MKYGDLYLTKKVYVPVYKSYGWIARLDIEPSAELCTFIMSIQFPNGQTMDYYLEDKALEDEIDFLTY